MVLRIVIGASTFAVKDRAPLKMLERAGVEIAMNPYGRPLTEAETIECLKGADGLIAGQEPLNRKVLASAAPRLKALARVGIGMDNVDQQAARELGIKVSNTPDPPTQAVAELTMAAMLSLVRGLPAYNKALHAGNWIKTIRTGLAGATLLMIGYGRIGRRVGEYARMFGAKLLVCDPLAGPETLANGERLVGLHEGLGQADIVSLHASGAKPILDRAAFDAMRPGTILLNSARGKLIEESALVDALQSGKVGAAWLDVFWGEPYNGEVLKFDQVLASPHAATHTAQCRLGMESEAVRNLLRDLGI